MLTAHMPGAKEQPQQDDLLRKRKPTKQDTPVAAEEHPVSPSSSAESTIPSALDKDDSKTLSKTPVDDDDKYSPRKLKSAVAVATSAAPTAEADTNISLGVLVTLTILALGVRLFQISNPSQVVFDEVHFGGFASKYINGTFFMDVHPPLGKLMIAASGLAAGFDGVFDFKEIGKDYIAPRVPYVSMRLLPGILGVLVVPMSYLTMKNLRAANATAVMTALFVAFENALTCQSRLILLDSILVFFTALSVQMWTHFQSVKNRPFTFQWWMSLALCGAGIGLAASVKWVGLFVIAWVGLSTVKYLWDLLGNPRVSSLVYIKHFTALATCLIGIPVVIYMLSFQIHFMMLPKIGSGTGFMSPEFQSTLQGNELTETFAEIAYGADIMIRHENTQGGYIHSHKHFYPTGSKQQQITLYPYADANSIIHILPALEFVNKTAVEPQVVEFKQIKHGDVVRLEHGPTKMKVHSHDHRAPVSDAKGNFEVSGYGAPGFLGDSNDHWRVEILDHDPENPYLFALQKFRLIHQNTGCALFSHAVKLPEWGFGQQEVLCSQNGKKQLSTWRIDFNENPLQPETSKKVGYPKPSFLSKFIESHKVMWRINSGLDGVHPYQSRPLSWPVLSRGISFWSAKAGTAKMHLMGNPLVWAAAGAALGLYVVLEAIAAVMSKRQMTYVAGVFADTTRGAGLLFMGWVLHYAPFFLMSRQLFLHHYLPSLYFSILLFGVLFDGITRRILGGSSVLQWIAASLGAAACIAVFVSFSPLTYGLPMSKEHCQGLKWRKGWDWDCK
ncbi:Dolichyl-phosphate-mannose-protein mannosyltransferase-domain-containing protein [Powellomyces hirtus]|nr:Dolichyl-phosphate-mannose-protein mannosyltransferase-domain-containing protein [Powellomyces hirtus]